MSVERFIPRQAEDDVHFSLIERRGERYIFLFTQETKQELMRIAEEYVQNPDLSFDRRDKGFLVRAVLRSERQ